MSKHSSESYRNFQTSFEKGADFYSQSGTNALWVEKSLFALKVAVSLMEHMDVPPTENSLKDTFSFEVFLAATSDTGMSGSLRKMASDAIHMLEAEAEGRRVEKDLHKLFRSARDTVFILGRAAMSVSQCA